MDKFQYTVEFLEKGRLECRVSCYGDNEKQALFVAEEVFERRTPGSTPWVAQVGRSVTISFESQK